MGAGADWIEGAAPSGRSSPSIASARGFLDPDATRSPRGEGLRPQGDRSLGAVRREHPLLRRRRKVGDGDGPLVRRQDQQSRRGREAHPRQEALRARGEAHRRKVGDFDRQAAPLRGRRGERRRRKVGFLPERGSLRVYAFSIKGASPAQTPPPKPSYRSCSPRSTRRSTAGSPTSSRRSSATDRGDRSSRCTTAGRPRSRSTRS